jgi:hypothetical protein
MNLSVIAQNQGQESNHSGTFLEDVVEKEFRKRGVHIGLWGEGGGTHYLFGDHQLLKHVPYRSIYGCQSRSEFLYMRRQPDIQVRIECRWQQVSGSVDEKFPYFLANARHVPERNVWLIVDGKGAKAQAIKWLMREAAADESKTIRVLDIIDYRKAVKILLERGVA